MVFMTILMLDEHCRAAIKTRHQRNALRLLLPAFHKHRQLMKLSDKKFNCRQLKKFNCRKIKKFNLLHYVKSASLLKDNDNDLISVTVRVAAGCVDLEHIVIKYFCLLMSFFIVAMIVVGRD
jgi:hypothetical protein